MKIGVLTGGGDCPGLNPAIRAIVMRALEYGDELIGLRQGWQGLREGLTTPLSLEIVEPIIDRGGTILGSSRTDPTKDEESIEKCLATAKKLRPAGVLRLFGLNPAVREVFDVSGFSMIFPLFDDEAAALAG